MATPTIKLRISNEELGNLIQEALYANNIETTYVTKDETLHVEVVGINHTFIAGRVVERTITRFNIGRDTNEEVTLA